MVIFLKSLAVVLIVAAVAAVGTLWFKTFLIGQLYMSAGVFLTALAALSPVVMVVGAFYLIREIVRLEV